MNIYTQLTQEYTIEPERRSARRSCNSRASCRSSTAAWITWRRWPTSTTKHEIRRQSDGSLDITCSCPDWKTRGLQTHRPCKHILALAMTADAQGLLASGAPANGNATPRPQRRPEPPVAPPPPQAAGARPGESFPDKVRKVVAGVVAQPADQVETVLQQAGVPFLVGPTGCGKTSAVRMCATRNAWGFEEVAGLFSFADGDLVGLKTGNYEFAGVFARAFRRARGGEEILLFLDELLRFNVRAQDLLMRPLQPVPVAVAHALGIATDQALRLVEAPLWGVEHAPADRVHIALAANPWGSSLDPALVRRVEPIHVGMADRVAQLFEQKIADAIQASWKAVERGELPLPIEYQSLLTAKAPDDTAFLAKYLLRLEVVDKAAADGYRHLLNGMSLALNGGNHG